MNTKKKKIVALVPCYNEESGIESVVQGFFRAAQDHPAYSMEVIVVDNNSTDETAVRAIRAGASVVLERKKGKGHAVQKGFASIPSDADYVVMIDGDDTYQSSEVFRLIEPLSSRFCNVVMGSRLAGRISVGAMSHFNRFGNWMFSFLVRLMYHANVTDVLTGYFAWDYRTLKRLQAHVSAKDFGIEMDMVTKMAILGESIFSVPITYSFRRGESELRPVFDGFRILKVFLVNLFWKPKVSYVLTVPRFVKS